MANKKPVVQTDLEEQSSEGSVDRKIPIRQSQICCFPQLFWAFWNFFGDLKVNIVLKTALRSKNGL